MSAFTCRGKTVFPLGVLVLCLVVGGVRAQECVTWRARHTVPGGITGHSMAYDSFRGVTVRFGGLSSTVSLAGLTQTWEYDGDSWTLRNSSGPLRSQGTAMAYDSTRKVTVLFGGHDYDWDAGAWFYSNDTWEWNGSSWVLRTQAGSWPVPRTGAAMTFDSVRNRVILFGGYSPSTGGVPLDDTWEWNGSVWQARTGSPRPSAGGGYSTPYSMAFDSLRGVAVLFTGTQTWEWNGSQWMLKNDSGGTPRNNAKLAYSSALQQVVLFGGEIGGFYTTDLQAWDGAQWTQVSDGGVPRRGSHGLAFDIARGRLVVFGGTDEVAAAFGDTWEWDGVQWTSLNAGPRPRVEHALAFDSARGVTVLHGGMAPESGGVFSDTWEWDGTGWTYMGNTAASGGVAKVVSGHSLAYDAARARTLLFGAFTDTALWDGNTWVYPAPPVQPPQPRAGTAMAYDSVRDVTVLFGGGDPVFGPPQGDTWEWDGAQWTQRATSGPAPRAFHRMAFDAVRGVTVLYGGEGAGAASLIDTWEWDGQSWTGPLADGPAYFWAYGPSMAFDVTRGAVLLRTQGTTYEWDGSAWNDHGYSDPAAWTAMAFDSARGVGVTFSGTGVTAESCRYDCAAAAMSGEMQAETFTNCPGSCYAKKNRYLSFVPPTIDDAGCDLGVALRVRLTAMPGPSNCPRIPDYSAFNNQTQYVGPEIYSGSTPTGVFPLQSTKYYRDWSTVPGGVVQVADCRIVPCATYTIDAVSSVDTVYSSPIVLTTTPVWGDIVGNGGTPGDGMVDALDVVALVQRFKDLPGAAPRTWCDVHANQPKQGVNLNIDALDISVVVSAFKGANYPFAGPTGSWTPCAP